MAFHSVGMIRAEIAQAQFQRLSRQSAGTGKIAEVQMALRQIIQSSEGIRMLTAEDTQMIVVGPLGKLPCFSCCPRDP